MRLHRVLFALACVAVVPALEGVGRTASAGPILYATNGGPVSQLYRIDPVALTVTLVGDTGLGRVGGLAIDSSGVLYGVSGGSQGPAALHTISLADASAMLIGEIIGIAGVEGLAFDSGGTLYGGGFTGGMAGTGRLLTLDAANGDILTDIGMSGSGNAFASGLAFDSSDQLFGSRGASTGRAEDLVRINTADGVQTAVGGMTAIISDIWFDATGTLYGVATNGDLFTINSTTGDKTLLFNTGISQLAGLTGINQAVVPEPSTLLLFSSGVAMLASLRRKRA